MEDLLADWQDHGAAAIRIMRIERPAEYVKVVAATLPREPDIQTMAVNQLDDDELDKMIEMLRERALTARQKQALELSPAPKALLNGH